jgi:hypothetical protein
MDLGFLQYADKILLGVHLKHSSFLPSASVKPMLNEAVHARPFTLS